MDEMLMPTSWDVYHVPMDEIVGLHGRTVAVNLHTLKRLGLAMAIREELIALGMKPRGDILGQLAVQAANEGMDVADITSETVAGILRVCEIQYIHELAFVIKVCDSTERYWQSKDYGRSLRIKCIYLEELNSNDTNCFSHKIIDGTSAIHADEIKFTAEGNSDMHLVLRGCYTQSGEQKHYEFADTIVDAIKTRCSSIHVTHASGAIGGLGFAKVTIKTTSGTYERTFGE